MRSRFTWIVSRSVLLCALLVAACQTISSSSLYAQDSVPVIAGGEAKVVIVLPEEAEKLERTAADELVDHLEKITGVKPTIVDSKADLGNLTPIYLGGAADASLDALTKKAGDNPSAFTIKVAKDAVHVRGLTDEGTCNGVYELLEEVGVRWYMPGDFGTVYPDIKTISFKVQTKTETPSMIYRVLQHLDNNVPWARRARLGGEHRSTGQHGIPGLNKDRFETEPELFSLINGERRAKQDCLSNPKTLEYAIAGVRAQCEGKTGKIYVGASSHDGSGYCECENCQALDQGVYDPTADRTSMTDRYIWFFNKIIEALEDEYPDLRIVTYTYGAHMMPPALKPHPNIVPIFAPITLDRTRSFTNPMSPDRHVFKWLIDEWAKAGVKEMYFRGYYHNLACAQFPYSQIDRIVNETRAYHERGISVMRVENIHTSWSSAFLDLYLATRMMWDVDTDVDALLDEFYKLYYGPAEKQMRAYHEGLNSAFDDTPYFTGSSYLYFPIFLNQPRTATLRSHLDHAAKAAGSGDNVYAKRVAAVRYNWDRFELFLKIIDARNKHDYKTAYDTMQAFYAKCDEGVAEELETGARRGYTNPRLLYYRERADNRSGYFNRFFSRPLNSAHVRTVEKGELVVGLDDEWLFLQDPPEIGEMAGYQRPGEIGGNWSPLKTSSRSWSDQGMHYYKGIGWYRQKVTIPAKFKGRKIYLWFGGVDELASVWINGHYVGTNREPAEGLPGIPGTFKPVDFPATDHVTPGEEVWVVARVQNKGLSELGTGGIVAPVMFWSPTGDFVPGADQPAPKKKKKK